MNVGGGVEDPLLSFMESLISGITGLHCSQTKTKLFGTRVFVDELTIGSTTVAILFCWSDESVALGRI